MITNRCSLPLLLAMSGLAPLTNACDPGDPAADHEQSSSPLFIGYGNCHQGMLETDVALFVDHQFQGPCVRVNLSEDRGWGAGNFPFLVPSLPNDAVTSVALGSQVELILKEDGPLTGNGLLTRSSKQNLGQDGLNFNDKTSSFYIQRLHENCQVVEPGQVCLFQDQSFNGDFRAGSERGVGSYSSSPFMGIANDSVSSIRVGSGVVATVCQDDDFQTCAGLIPGDYPLASQMPVGNDAISSMQVIGSCREWGGGNRCDQQSSSGVCSCADICHQASGPPCCFDKLDVCGL